MSTAVLALLVVGLVLFAFEVFVPGAILGLIGGFFLLGAVGLAFFEGGRGAGFMTLALALVSVAGMLWFEFRILPRTRLGRRLFLEKAIDGTSQPPVATEADAVVGREAIAATALAPTGLVTVGGRRYEARCDTGFAEIGARLKVTRIETFQLVVIALD
jgi:membrane-bound ClpP family serine protease